MVFDSEDDVDTLLERMSEMSYQQLRLTYDSLGNNNYILNSIIEYDSIACSVASALGIDLETDIEDWTTDQQDAFTYDLITELELNPNIISCYTVDIEDENGYVITTLNCISPLGGLDMRVLLNSHKICIIDKIVYKLIGDYILTVPVHKYEFLAYVDDVEDIEYLLTHEVEVYDLENNEVPYTVSYSPKRRLANSTPSRYDATSFTSPVDPSLIKTYMLIDFSAADRWGWWFITKRIGKARIRNYIYNSSTNKWIATKLRTTANMHFYSTTSYQTPGFCVYPWLNGTIYNKKINDRTFSQTRIANGSHYYRNFPVDIYWSFVYATNSGGATISYGVNQLN